VALTAASFPFCSKRCRLLDLGQWLDEGYRVPAEGSEPTGEEPPEESGA
jgi:endogenous inhibitor of DNA gyrase (YacG/DUF329 family)